MDFASLTAASTSSHVMSCLRQCGLLDVAGSQEALPAEPVVDLLELVGQFVRQLGARLVVLDVGNTAGDDDEVLLRHSPSSRSAPSFSAMAAARQNSSHFSCCSMGRLS